MRINKIDDQTNFKMALKISPKLQPELANHGTRYIESLDNYGKQIANIKLYNVVFDTNFYTPKILHRDKNITKDFFAELKNEESFLGKPYEIPAGLDGDTVSGFNPSEPRVFRKLYNNEAKDRYAAFKKLDKYEQAAQYSIMLQKLEIKEAMAKEAERLSKQNTEAQKANEQEILEKQAKDIIEKYKYEEPIKPEKAKKKWWQKIFG